MPSLKYLVLLLFTALPVSTAFSVPAEPETTVIFGGANHYAPYYYRDADDDYKGFDISLFNAVAREAGWQSAFRFREWETIQKELAAGGIDIAPMFVSPEREQRYLFSDPILVDNHLLYGRRGLPGYRALDRLSGLRVAAERGAYALDEIRRRGIEAELIGADSEVEALRMVAAGEADLAIVPSNVGYYSIEHEQLTGIVALSPPLLPITYAYAINPERPELVEAANQALNNLQQFGKIKQLEREWLSYDPLNLHSALWRSFWVIVPLLLLTLLSAAALWRYRYRLRSVQNILMDRESRLREAENQSRKDGLTKLPLRELFLEKVDKAIHDQTGSVAVGVLALLELDDIQQTVGYRAADIMVRKVANSMRKRHLELNGYLGQGTFAFVLENISSIDDALARTETMIQTACRNYKVLGTWAQPQVAAGIAIHPNHPDAAAELLRKAKIALFRANKQNESVLAYESAMEPDPRDLMLISDLKNALANDEFTWVYHPLYSIKQGRIIGAEMLIRWQHQIHGQVPPNQFVALAEQTGLIKQLTQHVIHQAIEILRRWSRSGNDWRLSINVSANDLTDKTIIEQMIKQLGNHASYLTLEITETAIMQDVAAIIANVDRLKKANIGIALDDYGTGYSSLEYLKAFNFDAIKIDMVFIQNIIHSDRDLKLTEASINLGHQLGAHVVAEGVENQETAELLIKMGCEILQGYGISKPLDIDAFDRFARNYRFTIGEEQ